MSKRSFLSFFSASTLALSFAFACGCAPEAPEPVDLSGASVDFSGASDGEVVRLSGESDYDEFVKSAPVVVVKFGAQWCPPCRAFEPDLLKQAGYFANRGVKYGEVDVDELGGKARDLGVQSIPDVRVYLDGRQYAQIVGHQPQMLANLVDSICDPAPETSPAQEPASEATSEKVSTADESAQKPLEEELWPEE